MISKWEMLPVVFLCETVVIQRASCRWREWCGLHPITNWEDLLGVMPNKSVKGYASVYATPEDIDLWTAGITEKPLPGQGVNMKKEGKGKGRHFHLEDIDHWTSSITEKPLPGQRPRNR